MQTCCASLGSKELFAHRIFLIQVSSGLSACEIEVGLNDQDWRPLDGSQDHYLATRMARNIAAYLNGGSPFPDTLRVDPLMERAVRGMVRDIGREVKDLRFRAVQQCVTDDQRPLDRSIRYVPIVFVERVEP